MTVFLVALIALTGTAVAQAVPATAPALRCVKVSSGVVRDLQVAKCPKGWVREASSGSTASAKRAKFLAGARALNSDLYLAEDDTLFSVGKSTCQVLDRGGNFDEIARTIIDSDLDLEVGAAILAASVNFLCPGHRQFLDNWLNT